MRDVPHMPDEKIREFESRVMHLMSDISDNVREAYEEAWPKLVFEVDPGFNMLPCILSAISVQMVLLEMRLEERIAAVIRDSKEGV